MSRPQGDAAFAAPFSLQVQLLCQRLLDDLLATPAVLIWGLVFGLGVLLVGDGLLARSSVAGARMGGDYLAFLLPAAVLSATTASRNAGYMVFNDLEDGYLHRLLTMPVSRVALVLAPMLVGGALATVQSIVVLAAGAVLGATPATGLTGAATIMAIAVVWGMGIAGYMVAAALVSPNVQVILTADLLFLPLLFLSPILAPREDLKDWIRVVADVNPTTYALEGMRALMLDGWQSAQVAPALAAVTAFACVTLAAAAVSAARFASSR